MKKGGRIDILVNNAAIAIGGFPVHEMTDEQWHRLIAVNLTSVFRGCKYALPRMIDAGRRRHHQHGLGPGPYRP